MRKRFGRFVGLFVILAGMGIYLYPDIRTWSYDRQAQEQIRAYEEYNHSDENRTSEQIVSIGQETKTDSEKGDGILCASGELRQTFFAYNRKIYEEHQKDFKDAWSAAQTPEVMDGIEDEMFGYIVIPVMDVEMPLYIGASALHMSKGAAVLGETSIPIGGMNTNSAIAGHRGWRGAPYFREIEKLSPGDEVFVVNPWETLVYRVSGVRIIDPDDSDAVKIQDGKDMITLITCHPYRSGGKYRYLVFCERADEAEKDAAISIDSKESEKSGRPPDPRDDLDREQCFRRFGLGVIILMAAHMCVHGCAGKIDQIKRKETRNERF